MAGEWPHLPKFQSEEDASAVAPDGWSTRQIEDIFDKLEIGKRFDQKTCFASGNVPVIDQSADGFVGYHDEQPGINASKTWPVITFANHTCEMRIMRRPFSVIQNVFPMVGRLGVCETLFFYYATKGRVHLEEYKGHYPDFRRLWISLPPLAEQKAIAAVLGALDDKIELNRRMNTTLEAMARALFQSWFVDFDPVRAKLDGRQPVGLDQAAAAIFPEHFEHGEHDMLPVGWRLADIEEVCAINAWTLGKSDDLETLEYVEISEVSRGNIANIATYPRGDEPSRARRRLRHGDTVLSTVRPDRGSYFLALNPPENRVASTGFAVLTPTKVPWSFLHAALTLPEVSDHLGQMADGGAYPAVHPEVIGAMQVALPNKPKILEAFHRLCSPLYEQAEANRTQSRTLATLRDALLPKLLSGELVVSKIAAPDELLSAKN